MLPLNGVKVLAIEDHDAGPFGTMHLADLGAEVIKIEDPDTGGDVGRYIPNPVKHKDLENDSLFFQSFNRNKKSISLSLKSDKGRLIFAQLVRKSDAVFINLSGDTAEKLGLTYESLKHVNPRIVCCSLNGWGSTGERGNFPDSDFLVQAATGIMSITGEPGDPPARCGLPILSFSTGIAAAYAICAGIYGARKTGQGMELEVSLLQTAVYLYTYLAIWNLYGGYKPERVPYSGHPTVVPSQNFPTQDGWIVFLAQKEKFWQSLCSAIEREELAWDERFKTMKDRFRNRTELVEILVDVFMQKSTKEWVDKLRAFGIPVSPINTVEQALQEREIQRFIINVEHEELGTLKEIMSSASSLGASMKATRAPKLGEHTKSILRNWLGMTDIQLRSLNEEGIIKLSDYADSK